LHDHRESKCWTTWIYEGYVHDLLADIGKERPMADLSAWIDARITAAPVANA
jgi:hypothetical protein